MRKAPSDSAALIAAKHMQQSAFGRGDDKGGVLGESERIFDRAYWKEISEARCD